MQIFLQDAVAFKLVWAAEAVRVQATAQTHPRLMELGEGPALTFTYGVCNQPAALLCQMGLASRTAALWAIADRLAQAEGQFHQFDRSGPFAIAYAPAEQAQSTGA